MYPENGFYAVPEICSIVLSWSMISVSIIETINEALTLLSFPTFVVRLRCGLASAPLNVTAKKFGICYENILHHSHGLADNKHVKLSMRSCIAEAMT
jgi:hypothetical protein